MRDEEWGERENVVNLFSGVTLGLIDEYDTCFHNLCRCTVSVFCALHVCIHFPYAPMPNAKRLQNKPLDFPAVRVARTILGCIYGTVARREYDRRVRDEWMTNQRQWLMRSRECRIGNWVTVNGVGQSHNIELDSTFGKLCADIRVAFGHPIRATSISMRLTRVDGSNVEMASFKTVRKELRGRVLTVVFYGVAVQNTDNADESDATFDQSLLNSIGGSRTVG